MSHPCGKFTSRKTAKKQLIRRIEPNDGDWTHSISTGVRIRESLLVGHIDAEQKRSEQECVDHRTPRDAAILQATGIIGFREDETIEQIHFAASSSIQTHSVQCCRKLRGPRKFTDEQTDMSADSIFKIRGQRRKALGVQKNSVDLETRPAIAMTQTVRSPGKDKREVIEKT